MRSKPENKLSKSAIKAWRLTLTIVSLFLILIPMLFWVFSLLVPGGSSFSTWTMVPLFVVLSILCGLGIFFIPEIRWQRWYYQVR
ncbi:MAG: hypothetical protein U5J63_08965 [Fodinibius sp.]|nr:hypothetical protein [Fodinibius sp.]